jgi:hypothetical protein
MMPMVPPRRNEIPWRCVGGRVLGAKQCCWAGLVLMRQVGRRTVSSLEEGSRLARGARML